MSNRQKVDTSIGAWKELRPSMLASHYGKILAAMRLLNEPSSMEKIGDKAGLTYEQTHKRFSELERESLVFKNGKGKTKAGRSCYLYSLVNQTESQKPITNEEVSKMSHDEFWEALQSGKLDIPEKPQIIQKELF
jgi:predicted ArsR family transcriptional regulator